MALLVLVSLCCLWFLLGVCVRSTDWALMATSQMASSAVARIVPGGAATATAVQYRMVAEAGVAKSTAATGLTVATILNFAVLLLLPVFALPAILFGPPIAPLLLRAAAAGIIGFVSAGIIGGLFLLWDRPMILLGRAIDFVAQRLGRPRRSRAERFLESRNLIRSHLASNWYLVVLASFGKWGFEYLALVMAVRGVGHDDLSSVLLLAFVAASLLAGIPFTPGGLGFVEAGLTGMLALAGLSAGDAVLATLAYRLVSYWLPIPLGALAYAVHRRRLDRRGTVVERLSQLADRQFEEPSVGPEKP
jgi:uncharacterized protein (TIRG00374 family)